ncbi:hypothetical protein NA78x_004770 [Anatilimnocola sp. NA78]|uniref:hypothetical protein n=1 Tax=Anatilimnocola sp. NA78 TaxID=3415683 RepID=UPI003CE51FE6
MFDSVLNIQALGLILYSAPAVAHIHEGTDYLSEQFMEPADVARHVMGGQLTAFGTGSSGSFCLRISVGQPDEARVQAAEFKLRLSLQVHTGFVCVRDLYDLMEWAAECPVSQQFPVPDGWYRLTVFTSRPPSKIFGDEQEIELVMEPVSRQPQLHWEGVPSLCG